MHLSSCLLDHTHSGSSWILVPPQVIRPLSPFFKYWFNLVSMAYDFNDSFAHALGYLAHLLPFVFTIQTKPKPGKTQWVPSPRLCLSSKGQPEHLRSTTQSWFPNPKWAHIQPSKRSASSLSCRVCQAYPASFLVTLQSDSSTLLKLCLGHTPTFFSLISWCYLPFHRENKCCQTGVLQPDTQIFLQGHPPRHPWLGKDGSWHSHSSIWSLAPTAACHLWNLLLSHFSFQLLQPVSGPSLLGCLCPPPLLVQVQPLLAPSPQTLKRLHHRPFSTPATPSTASLTRTRGWLPTQIALADIPSEVHAATSSAHVLGLISAGFSIALDLLTLLYKILFLGFLRSNNLLPLFLSL